MTTAPLISIITICYNAENYIIPTLESVANQIYENIEHIIIDGNSIDNTLNIVKSFPHVKTVVSENDEGLYDAMNKGIEKSNGDYICFMNGGDLFYSKSTLKNVFSNSNNEDFIYGDTIVFNNNGDTRPYHKKKPTDKTLSYRSFINGMVICHQSIIVKRSCIEKYNNKKYKISADIDWVIRTLKNCKSVKDVEFKISKFLDGGVSQKNRWKAVKERFIISVDHFGLVDTIFNQTKLLFIYLKHNIQ